MDANAPGDLMACFDALEDPRMERTRKHHLGDILALTLLAVIAGAEGFTEVEDFGNDEEDWLKTFLRLPAGIPSHDTIGRVFAALDPHAFEACFLIWVQGLIRVSDQKALHIDGKTLRRSFDAASSKAAIHMVSAWASKAELALCQLATDAKSNEITTIPRLLELVTLHGAVVTIDAMGCQTAIAEKIVQGGGHYILAVKKNQPELYEEIRLLMDEGIAMKFEGMGYDFHASVEKGHGRLETRRVWVTREVDWLGDRGRWAGLRGAVCVESERQILDPIGGVRKTTAERRYYITSVDHRDRGREAAWFGGMIRSHWGIENQLHWTLDMAFGEDSHRIREGYAAENFSRVNRMALNLLKLEKTFKRGIRGKRLKAARNREYLLQILQTEI